MGAGFSRLPSLVAFEFARFYEALQAIATYPPGENKQKLLAGDESGGIDALHGWCGGLVSFWGGTKISVEQTVGFVLERVAELGAMAK
ncbi:hypothetical protein RBSH_02745 [Rhodopirellula baltica SH28]|uniref:Uncharacterized protein n=1 Tax=Rhodopirellula baltica SH28 TaxID=993517 RepID=K5CDW0_RHOBT|nr:hypothetical protein RBSH_02745 [Rhodopirellula baltica SH28]